MSNAVDLSKMIPLLEADEDFSITESQYLKNTGKTMPKDTYYLKKRSALSRLAQKYGFQLEIHERTIIVTKKNEKEEL